MEEIEKTLEFLQTREGKITAKILPFEYDTCIHNYRCPKCGSTHYKKEKYNHLDYSALAGSAGIYWICLDCEYEFDQVIIQS